MESQEIEISFQETKKLQQSEKYKNYINWLKENKVLIDPGLTFPTVFQKGLVGVSTNTKIQQKKAIVAVPFHIIINSQRVKQMEIYQGLINENPVLYNGYEGDVYLLCTFLIIERLKGEQGFYHPYFQIVGSSQILNWNKRQITEIVHSKLRTQMIEYKQEIQQEFVSLLRIIRTNPEIFPQQLKNNEYKTHFEWAYEFVRTRAFQTNANSISLIPFADAFNHGNPSLSHQLIDLTWWKNRPQEFAYKRKKFQLSIFNQQNLRATSQQLQTFKKPITSSQSKYIQKHKYILQGNKQKLSQRKAIQRIAYLQYNTNQHTLRQLQLFQQDEIAYDDQDDVQQSDYRRYLKKQKQNLSKKNIDSKVLIKDYWNIFQQKVIKHNRIKNAEQQQQQQEQQDQELSAGSKRSWQQQQEQSSDQQNDLFTKSQDQNIYFIVYTQQQHEKNTQIYNSYGNRSNNFLLLHYNFAIPQNPYDYYNLRLKIDGIKKKPQQLVIFDIPKKQKGQIITKQIRIRQNTLCIQLINHCRYILSPSPLKSIILPTDKQLQKKTLALSKSIIKYLFDQYQTSNQQDQQLLQNKTLNNRLYSAITVRVSHKQILSSQMKLLTKAMDYLNRFKNKRIEIKESEMQDIGKIRCYLENLQRSNL